MEELSICRICLVADIRMRCIANTHLQEMFQSLTCMPLVSGDKPLHACYICCAKLQKCYLLRRSCLRSEKLLSQKLWKCKVWRPTDAGDMTRTHGLAVVAVTNMSVGQNPDCNVQMEASELFCHVKPEAAQVFDSIEMKVENAEAFEEEEAIALEDHAQSESFTHSEDELSLAVIKKELDYGTQSDHRYIPETLTPAVQSYSQPSTASFSEDNEIVEVKVLDDKEDGSLPYTSTDYADKAVVDSNEEKSMNELCSDQSVNSTSLGQQKSYPCEICQKCFNRKSNLGIHMRRHAGEKPHQCNICNKCFITKSSLNIHRRTHTGEKPYQCDVCKKCYTQNSHLKTHMRIHTGEKQHQCHVCQEGFMHKSTLLNHVLKHTGEKPFQCNVCKKCFVDRRSLNSHNRTHTGERPYQCALCGKCFWQKSPLITHIRTHTGEKPFKCHICKKGFILKSALKTHILKHTGEKPYQCDVCKKSFYSKGHFNRHMLIHS